MLRCAYRLLVGCAALLIAVAAPAAEVYPAKLVKIVVPFAAGGSTDLLTRSVAQQLSEAWKRPVVVENRAGGGGVVGSEYVVKSPADGYTLLLGTNTTHAAAATLYAKLPYDLRRDFAPITEIASIPLILSVHPSIPVKSVKELVALAKAKPGDLNFGGGTGAAAHMAMELFESMAKIKMVHVPHKGMSPALTDLMAGQVQVLLVSAASVEAQIKSSRLRAIGMSTAKRSSFAPNLPTIAESGLPGYDVSLWWGIFAPVKTPRPVIERLNAEINKILVTEEIKKRFADFGAEPTPASPEAFTAMFKSEIVKWSKVVKESGIKAE